MYEYDILVSMKFFSKEKGGRTNLPPIKENEYTYRPVIKFENEKAGYCCGIVIGDYIQNYNFDSELLNVKVIFLQYSKIQNKLTVGKHFFLYEGNVKIGEGDVLKLKK